MGLCLPSALPPVKRRIPTGHFSGPGRHRWRWKQALRGYRRCNPSRKSFWGLPARVSLLYNMPGTNCSGGCSIPCHHPPARRPLLPSAHLKTSLCRLIPAAVGIPFPVQPLFLARLSPAASRLPFLPLALPLFPSLLFLSHFLFLPLFLLQLFRVLFLSLPLLFP